MGKANADTPKQKIALIIPPTLEMGQMWCPNLPIGLAYLAAVIEKAGHELALIDCQALQISHKMLGEKLAAFKPDVVGITSVTPFITSTLMAAKVAKENCPDAPLVLGGPHATFMDTQILKEQPNVDVIVRGEGEETILDLLSKLPSGDLKDVLGITFRMDGQVIRNPNRPYIQDLDALPYPAYHYFALEKYNFFGRRILPILTSRGCPYQCAYCVSSRMVGTAYRARDPIKVADELEWLKNEQKAGTFSFYDDAFTYDQDRAVKICQEIKRRKIGIPWDCQTRVDKINREVLTAMKEADCQLVSFGAESGCQKILDAVHKRTTVEQNEAAIKLAKSVGLSVAMSVVIGYPSETAESLQQTFSFIKRAKPDYVYLCLATPYPGTALRSTLEELGWSIEQDWSRYDMQVPAFENPLLPVDLVEARRDFYNHFYSWGYIMRQYRRNTFYSKSMARTALNDRIWRSKSLRWVFTNLHKLRGHPQPKT